MHSYYQKLFQVHPFEAIPLESTNPIDQPNSKARVAQTPLYRWDIVATLLGSILHAVLGVLCCVLSVYVYFNTATDNTGWATLHSFGPLLPLLTARYLNFAFDICARTLSVTLELLAAFAGIRVATALHASPRGISVSDVLTLNRLTLNVTSIWATFRARIPVPIKASLVLVFTCGIVMQMSGSLLVGYKVLLVEQLQEKNIQIGGNNMFLGSNTSGMYHAPDYSLLAPSSEIKPHFTGAVAQKLMQIGLFPVNQSIASFDLSAETHSSLRAQNITRLLVNHTVSSQLIDCQSVHIPVPESDQTVVPFGAYNDGTFVTQVWQNVSSTSMQGVVNQFQEKTQISNLVLTLGRFSTLSFIMTFAGSSTPTPSPMDDSQVLIVLAQRENCTGDHFQTAFGPMYYTWMNTTITGPTTIRNFPLHHLHATLSCRNMRTINRTVYTQDGTVLETSSQSFYAKPVLDVINQLYMYRPLANNGVVGIGALLSLDLAKTSTWTSPTCLSKFVDRPPNQTELDMASAAWSDAVARVQHYESSLLEVLVKQNMITTLAPVLVQLPMYRLAVLPIWLLIYGVTMTGASIVLTALLVQINNIDQSAWRAEGLTVYRVANDLSARKETGDVDTEVEIPEKVLRMELGAVRIRRRAKRVV